MALLRRQAEPNVGFGVVLEHFASLHNGHAQAELGAGVCLRRQCVITEGFFDVGFYAQSVFVENSQVILRGGVFAIGRFLEPVRRLLVILFHTQSLNVEGSQVVLSGNVALFCGFSKPVRRFPIILPDNLPDMVGQAEAKLRYWIAFFRRLKKRF